MRWFNMNGNVCVVIQCLAKIHGRWKGALLFRPMAPYSCDYAEIVFGYEMPRTEAEFRTLYAVWQNFAVRTTWRTVKLIQTPEVLAAKRAMKLLSIKDVSKDKQLIQLVSDGILSIHTGADGNSYCCAVYPYGCPVCIHVDTLEVVNPLDVGLSFFDAVPEEVGLHNHKQLLALRKALYLSDVPPTLNNVQLYRHTDRLAFVNQDGGYALCFGAGEMVCVSADHLQIVDPADVGLL